MSSGVVQDLAAAGPRAAWLLVEGADRTVALHWNGARWREVGRPAGVRTRMPDPLPAHLEVLSASPGGPAWSLGYDAKAKKAVALRFQRGRWVRQRLPVRMSAASTVAARSAKDVWIACTCELPGTGPTQALLHWNGERWRTVRYPATDETFISKIAPTSARNVWAYRAGYHSPAQPALLRWNGSGWRTAPIPSTSPGYYFFPNLADDGRGGAVTSASLSDPDARYLHYGGGRWTKERGGTAPGAPPWSTT